MKRLHVHVVVKDLQQSIDFYSTLFAVAPSVMKPDYAKWMLDDPCVNFAISQRGQEAGLDHLGIQVDANDELQELAGRLKNADMQTRDEVAIACCYAKGNKSWVSDPSGIKWETFFTFGEATNYGDIELNPAADISADAAKSACCIPPPDSKSACCA